MSANNVTESQVRDSFFSAQLVISMGCGCSVPEINENAPGGVSMHAKDAAVTVDSESNRELYSCTRPMGSDPSETPSATENAPKWMWSLAAQEHFLITVGDAIDLLGSQGGMFHDSYEYMGDGQEPSEEVKTGFSADVLEALQEWDDECASRSDAALNAIMQSLRE